MASEAVFKLVSGGKSVDDYRLRYVDIIERGYPNDPKTNWGRTQNVRFTNNFVDGKLVPLNKPDYDKRAQWEKNLFNDDFSPLKPFRWSAE